jgi:polyferredoxin
MGKPRKLLEASQLSRSRPWIQGGFLLVWLDPLMLRLHTVCGPVFHCYSCPLATFACPIGVLANFSAIHLVPFMALGTLICLGAVFGGFICGWACPFGFFQDLLAKIPTRKFVLPAWVGYGRYAVLLGLVVAVPYLWGEAHPLFFCRVCPAGALEAALPYAASTAVAGSAIAWPSMAKIVILSVLIVAALFTWRPWCTLFCPLGAIYGLFNKLSFCVVRFRPDQCRECATCRSLCRHGARPLEGVDTLRCVRCLDCARCQAVTLGTAIHRSTPCPAVDASGTPGYKNGGQR